MKVGLNITSTKKWALFYLGSHGPKSNSFTGDTNVTGEVILQLNKGEDIVSISGDLNLREGARLELYRRGQIAKTSRVLLQSGKAKQSTIRVAPWKGHAKDFNESFHQLVVEGNGVIEFTNKGNQADQRLILDDLEITNGSRLLIKGWESGRDFLLVRKDSAHLKDARKKITFVGGGPTIDLADYDKDYYSIINTPEPAIYGAGIMAVSVAALAYRRRAQHRSAR